MAQEETGLKFSPEAEEKFQEIIHRYPIFPANPIDPETGEAEPKDQRLAALLPALLLAQSEFGWISVEVMDYLAGRLNLHPAKVLSTATFYTMYNKQPIGKCHVQVCTTLTCALRGGYELLEHLEDRFGIRVGETSADGKWTLSEVECLASCGTAPMFQATFSDGEIEYYEDLDMNQPERVESVLKTLNQRLESLQFPKEMHD